MNENEILQLIKRSVSDTKHVLNDGKPFEGIKKVLCSWLLTLFICNFLNSFFTHLSMTFYFYGSNIYYCGIYSICKENRYDDERKRLFKIILYISYSVCFLCMSTNAFKIS